jgi:UPF0755 protein
MQWNNPLTVFVEETLAAVLGIILVIAGIAIGGSYWWYSTNTSPYSQDTTQQEIVIEEGETLGQAAQRLENDKIIRNAFAFRLWAKLTGDDYTVQAGSHKFSPSMTLLEVSQELTKGKITNEVSLQFKEGLRVEEIDEVAKQGLDPAAYNSQDFLAKAKSREGTFFPNTYRFAKDATADDVMTKLNNEFEKKYKELQGPQDAAQKKRILIIASLLEREGKTNEDRPIIAGIINNRLEINMALQLDATLQYALNTKRNNTWWPSPSVDDKAVNSPFNTYQNPGLPPSPICNPGESSLRAALHPQENNYLYYLHDTKGNAYYGKTLDEHNRNIAKYL